MNAPIQQTTRMQKDATPATCLASHVRVRGMVVGLIGSLVIPYATASGALGGNGDP